MKRKLPWGEFLFLGVILCYIVYYFMSVKGLSTKAVLWPYCLMIATVIIVVGVAVELLRSAPVEEAKQETSHLSAGQWIKRETPVFVIILSFILYTLLLNVLGLHLCNFLLTFFLVLYLNKGKWKVALLAAAIITLAFFLVFDLTLGIRLPKFDLF